MTQKKYVLGLDIGSFSLKLAYFKNDKDGLKLLKAERVEMGISDEPLKAEGLAPLLEKLLEGIDVKNSKCVVSLNSPETAMKIAAVPPIPRKEMQEAIFLESKNYFPFPIDNSFLDFKISEDPSASGPKKNRVLAVVIPESHVREILKVLAAFKIRPLCVVPASYAVLRALSFIPASEQIRQASGIPSMAEDETTCILDMGDRFTECIFLKGRTPVFARKIVFGGRNFTKALTETLVSDRGKTELTFEEAERIKRATGIPSGMESEMVEDKISTTEILSMMTMPLEQFTGEVERCFDYFREESGSGKVNRILLLGGGAQLKGLPEMINRFLGVEAVACTGASAVPAVGCGFTDGRGINLLPPEAKQELQKVVTRVSVQTAVAAGAVLLVLFYLGLRIQAVNYQKRTAVARQELVGLSPLMEKAQKINLTNRIMDPEPFWDDAFKEIANRIPSEIFITEWEMKDFSFLIKGQVVSAEKERALSDFILSLEKGIFNKVTLVTAKELEEPNASEFELKCWID